MLCNEGPYTGAGDRQADRCGAADYRGDESSDSLNPELHLAIQKRTLCRVERSENEERRQSANHDREAGDSEKEREVWCNDDLKRREDKRGCHRRPEGCVGVNERKLPALHEIPCEAEIHDDLEEHRHRVGCSDDAKVRRRQEPAEDDKDNEASCVEAPELKRRPRRALGCGAGHVGVGACFDRVRAAQREVGVVRHPERRILPLPCAREA